jgi:hypothetical protein
MEIVTALDWFNNELDDILELYPSEWVQIQKVFIEAKKKELEKIENSFNYLNSKIWDLDDENFTVPNRLLEIVEEAKQILLQEYENESMNFHECSECNIRCNCTTAKCSCSCRTES